MTNYCKVCGCAIGRDGIRTIEEVETGRSTGVSRTGLMNFDLNKMRFSSRRYFRKISVYY